MDFLVRKFSDWLNVSNISHELIRVKGGYIIRFIEPDEDLKKLISSLFITIDTGETKNHIAIRKPVNVFTSGGDGIVMEEKYIGDILSTVYPVLHDYAIKKAKGRLGGN